MPNHRLGRLVLTGPVSPGPLQFSLVSWVEILIHQAQLWPKITMLWQGLQLGGGRHLFLMEQKWASSLSLPFCLYGVGSLGPQACEKLFQLLGGWGGKDTPEAYKPPGVAACLHS